MITDGFLQTTVKTLALIKPTRDLRTRLTGASAGMDDWETKDLNLFVDLTAPPPPTDETDAGPDKSIVQ